MKTSRRKFIENSIKVTALTAGIPLLATAYSHENLAVLGGKRYLPAALKFSQVALPYAYNALEPSIDATTMDIHYNKHHTSYIKNVNEAIAAENVSFSTEQEFFKNASKLSTKAKNSIFDVEFQLGDWLVFGKETKGLDEDIVRRNESQAVYLPMPGQVRSLNLSNAVAVAVYELLRQTSAKGKVSPPEPPRI